MFNKKNPMRYFSGSTFARLPLYKLAAGGTAVVLTASIGLGAFAASVGPLSAPEPSPTPIVTATPETAATPTPSPTPSPTPEPDKPLTMEASVIQQDVGVTLYVENAPEPSPTPDASASPSPTPSKSAKEDDAENEKTPLLGVAATITLTDAKGNATDYELDTETGTALAEDVTPGDYTLAVQPIEGYTQPEAQTVTVKEKVVYKADVKAVKEKIVQASQVNESAEDSGVSNAGSAPIVNEVTDTVTYADSARTETGSKTSYTAKLWARWRQIAPVCSGAQSSISARLKTGISPARYGEKSYTISINCRRSQLTTKRCCCMTARLSRLTASKLSAFSSPAIHGGIWSISLTTNISSPATLSGSARTAATVSFPLWQKATNWR